MGGAVKAIVSIAVAVAAPYVAAPIATALKVTSVVAKTALSAAVSAGLNAASAAVLGEDVGKSALFGAIGGGFSGYQAATAAGTGGAAGAAGAQGSGVPALLQRPVAPAAGTGATSFYNNLNTFVNTPGMSGFGVAPPFSGAATGSLGGNTFNTLADAFGSGAAGAGGGGLSELGGAVVDAVKGLPSQLASKMTPENFAEFTLRAAGQLAGSSLAGSGLSAEEQQLLNARTEELRQLQQTNQALFNQQLQQAQNMIGEAKYFDPEYFGLQSARRAQIAGGLAQMEGTRGLTGAARDAAERRYQLGTARNVGTAYDVGYGQGVQGQLGQRQAGLNAMPASRMYETPALSQQMADIEYERARREEREKGLSALFGNLTA